MATTTTTTTRETAAERMARSALAWRDTSILSIDALFHAAVVAAERAYALARTECDPDKAAALRAVVGAAQAAQVASIDALRAMLPGAEECAYCGTPAQVAYRQRGDLYLCQRCYVNHDLV